MERRLAAILALDVEGYSRLMGRDEKRTHELLRADLDEVVGPLIRRHAGAIHRIEGDDVLAEFASVVAAVDAARKIQIAMARRNSGRSSAERLNFRIGINAGEVCWDGTTLFGDTVNIAFRLEAIAPAGGVAVSEAVKAHLGNRLETAFVPRGAVTLKNIAEPVQVFELGPPSRDDARSRLRLRKVRKLWKLAPLAVAVIFALAWGALTLRDDRPVSGTPSIAVLPFSSTSTTALQQNFVEGITHDIMTDLAKFQGLSVVSATATSRYRDTATAPGQIGRELGVRYILEGNVQWLGENVRVNAQLVDARTERHIWAQRYDVAAVELDIAQDTISEKVARVIGPIGSGAGVLRSEEDRRIRAAPADSLLSYEYYLSGLELFERYDREGTALSQQAFARALSLDPNHVPTLSYLALAYLNEYRLGWSAEPALALSNAITNAERAVVADPRSSQAFRTLGFVRHYQGLHDQAKSNLARALELNPNDTEAKMFFGWAQTFAGQAADGLETMKEAFDETPYPPGWFLYDMAWANFMLRDYDEAARVLEQRVPPSTYTHLLLGLIYIRQAQDENAADHIAIFMDAVPDYSVTFADSVMPFAEDGDREHFLDTLRMAGVPED